MAVTDEVADLKKQFGNACKIIEKQGDFHYIITITPTDDSPFKIQFSIYDSYPQSIPEIYVKTTSTSSIPSSETREKLRLFLVATAEPLRDKPMLRDLITAASVWLKPVCSDMKQTDPAVEEPAALPQAIERKAKTEKGVSAAVSAENPETESGEDEKLSRLRTASDVISRILWDKKLDPSCFCVGYHDRFAGLVEEKFNAFCWDQPLSAVDNDTLAIPQHRIQYFKYKQLKVWDKNERLDRIFGSAGNTSDIYEFIDEFETAVDKAGFEDKLADDEEDEDIDFNKLLADDEASPAKKFLNVNRPNFFVAVRITDPDVLSKALEITDHICALEPAFKICCLPLKCLHITLATLRLEDMDDITHGVAVIRQMRDKLREAFPDPIALELDQLDTFYQKVLYSKVKDNRTFMDFADQVRNNLEMGRVKIVDNHSFIPHMTLLKITRPIQRQFFHSRLIDPSLYSKFKGHTFGKQIVEKIYLCPIGVDRREDGFYQTVMEMEL